MMDNFIQLKKKDTVKLPIKTDEGMDTGEFLEFDIEDIELPLRFQNMMEKSKKNFSWLRNQFLIIDKRQDVKGKKLMSKNEEDKFKATNDYFAKQIETYNMFLGENGVQKLLNGHKVGWTTFDEIDEIIDKQILPHLEVKKDDLVQRIMSKYGNNTNAKEVLK